jgi:hypothetical protein
MADKYKLLHFSCCKADQDPSHTPSVLAGPVTISENLTRPYLQWLGILFNKKLSFKFHVRQMTLKALTIANALRSLGNIVQGVNPYLMQQAVTACVLRKVYYGAKTWWPGRTRPGSCKDLILNLVQNHLHGITKVILAGARAVLLVYQTTLVPVLYWESGLLLAKIELDYLAAITIVRLRRLDPYYPLCKRAEGIAWTGL